MEGFTFSTTVRVRFADTDAQGIAHNSKYFVWFEVARVEYLRAFTGGYQSLRDHGIEALVLESHCRYVQPARSTTCCTCTRAASGCAARASATSTRSCATTARSSRTATPSTRASMRRR